MSSRKSHGDGASSSKRKATTPSSSSSSLHTDDDSLSSKSNNSSSDDEQQEIDLMAERIHCSCQLCKRVVVQTRRKSIQHCDRHGLYTPPQPAAPTCHPPIIDKSELEALFKNVSAKVAADALQDLDRILGLSPLTAVDNIQPSSAKRIPRTRLQTSGREIKDISWDDTIFVSGRHRPTSLTGLAAKRFTEYDSTVQGVPRIIPTHTPVEIWRRRWIVKESTLPDTGLGVFAMDKIEVASNCTPDNLPQLFPYDNVFPDIRAFNWHRKKSISSLLPTEPGFPGQPNIETACPGPSVETEDILTDSEDDEHEVLADFIETYYPPVAAEVDTEDNMSLPPQGERQPLHDDAHTPLYHGAKVSKLTAVLLLTNLQQKYNVPNVFMDGLFGLLKTKILPEGNQMPDKRSSAKRMLSTIGLDYQCIHACPNDCYLYRDIPDDTAPRQTRINTQKNCPICGTSRYRADTMGNKVPAKVLMWFPIIPRLLHIYKCKSLAELMLWHSTNRSNDGVMRSIADSPAMRHAENAYHEMADNPRAVRLGMVTDGFSPVSFSRKSYSIWPVMFINYNIPPWLSTKKGHILLSLIIPGPKKPSNFDIYMGPVVDELKLLWNGVPAYDARLTCPEEQWRFT
ncbi:hypothetical protein R1sor_021033 [Riccia sorocarpa]|uniref:Transposase n=1 Tax=Riccia sorocarpa TaxID=122646 RepID=A0ABD3GFV9_9MARC